MKSDLNYTLTKDSSYEVSQNEKAKKKKGGGTGENSDKWEKERKKQ